MTVDLDFESGQWETESWFEIFDLDLIAHPSEDAFPPEPENPADEEVPPFPDSPNPVAPEAPPTLPEAPPTPPGAPPSAEAPSGEPDTSPPADPLSDPEDSPEPLAVVPPACREH